MNSVDENITRCLEEIDANFVKAIDIVSSISRSVKGISLNLKEMNNASQVSASRISVILSSGWISSTSAVARTTRLNPFLFRTPLTRSARQSGRWCLQTTRREWASFSQSIRKISPLFCRTKVPMRTSSTCRRHALHLYIRWEWLGCFSISL